MRVGIYDKNEHYVRRVCEIMNEKYLEDMELVPLKDMKNNGLNGASFDVLLINLNNTSGQGNIIKHETKIPVVYLSEEQGEPVRDGKVYIFKYNDAQTMHASILESVTLAVNLKNEAERREKERQEAERRERERQEAERRERERQETERRERERQEAERRERERQEAERRERERQEAERRERERQETERRERERQEAERGERERQETERRERERQEAERREKEHQVEQQEQESLEDINLSGINTKVITYMSLGGGMGSSTVAAGTASYFAKIGKRVLYINLKPFNGTGYLSSKGENISLKDIIEDIQHGCANTEALFNNICISQMGVYILDNFKENFDMEKLNKHILAKLILQADSIGKFDIVIFDIHASWTQWVSRVLELSDKICIVADGSEFCNTKLQNVFSLLNDGDRFFWQKTAVIYNKYKTMPKVAQYVEAKVMGGIGYMDSEKPQDVINRMLNMKFLNNLIK